MNNRFRIDQHGMQIVDFGAIPPEINSALMYAGAGTAPLLTAASAWNGIADELSAAASCIESVVTRLSTEQWVSPASLSMAAAAQPFVAWLKCTAESSAHAAAQAMSSAAAYETAFAMTLSPAEVAANRAQLAVLIETDTLGQNTPAIAATEAQYGEMWARDASAMYAYAASSAVAGRLNPLTSPPPSTNLAGIADQAAVGRAAAAGAASAQQAALSNLISDGPAAAMSIASPNPSAAAAPGTGIIGLFAAVEAYEGKVTVEALSHSSATFADFGCGSETYFEADDDAVIAEDEARVRAAHAALSHPVAPPEASGGKPALATVGNARSVVHLSVPANWPDSQPATSAAPAVDGTYWAIPEHDESIDEIPLAPGMAATSGRTAALGPRYGVKPVVMPQQGIF